LSKREFRAGLWFTSEQSNQAKNIHDKESEFTTSVPDKVRKALSPFMPKDEAQTEAGFKKYFIPGWNGAALTSKEVALFNKILSEIQTDARYQFLNLKSLNRRTKLAIFDEFLSYAEYMAVNCTDLDNYQIFWKALTDQHSKYREVIDNFIEIYSFRISVVFLLKSRFISVLMNEMNYGFELKSLLYPTSFITNVFKKGSRNELYSSIIEPNIYSWYRPGLNLSDSLKQFFYCAQSLCVTDIIKNISIRSEQILKQKTLYSHTLSHKNFGFFLNSLLLNLPLWKNTLSDQLNISGLYDEELEIVSCKYVGDYLESMALSHWLAQEHNKDVKWDQILCPDFKKNDFQNGDYLKLINEIQFLTFLSQISKQQGHNPIDFISKTSKGHKNNLVHSSGAQANLLQDEKYSELTYDRVILNLTEIPKNNSQHYMINKILEESSSLKDNGMLFVVSTRKLFIASQKTKIENLLNKLKVESIITLEDLPGKGEVGSYIYVLSNRKNVRLKSTKENVLHFRFSGELDTFAQFSSITRLIQSFFINNLADIPPMYQKNINKFKIEFFQDAIVEGRLIHSSSKDSTKITHPLFFKNLMNSCLPLEAFFDIQQVNFEKAYKEETPLFEYNQNQNENPSDYVLIVDKRFKERPRLEIIPTSVLELKSYEYGVALCHYFYIYPKVSDLSLNAISDFYRSSIGRQIVELTFSSENKKIKANLTQLLLPKFYAESPELPEHISRGLGFIHYGEEEILNMHPSLIEENFNNVKQIVKDIAAQYPMAVTHSLSNFKYAIERCLSKLGADNKNQRINFNNPALKSPLLLSKTYAIYPENEDVYVEFNNENSLQLIHSPFTSIKQKKTEIDGVLNHFLEIYHNEILVITLFSEEEMLSFISYILKSLENVPMSAILQGIKVPRISDLKSIINSFHSMQKSIAIVSEELPGLIDQIINHKISKF